MKFLIFVSLLLTQTAMAGISGSSYELRHQAVIEEAVARICGLNGVSTQLSSEEVPVQVDQGIRDVYFTTVLSVRVGIDQYMYDEYSVVVKSVQADFYHEGNYFVSEVKCNN